ncbi:hypothetical protein, partial [Seinonella peptonophila]|uniref:hypothetical protein n=1 Tax=Seinonella peptonophila TaxID=112248 RepID=UPI0015875D41
TSPTLWSRIRKNWKLYVTLMTIPMMAAGVSTNLLSDLVKLIGGKLYDWMLAPLFGHEKTATLVAAAFHDYMANVSPDLHVVIIQSLL